LKPRLSFQVWILGGCVLVVICTLIFVASLLQRSLTDQMVRQRRQALHQQLLLVKEMISQRRDAFDSIAVADVFADKLGKILNNRLTLIAPDGRVLGDSEVPASQVAVLENHANRPEVRDALAKGEGWSLRRSSTLGLDLLYLAEVLTGPDGRPQLILRLAVPLSELEKTVGRARRLIIGASFLGVLLALGVAYLVSRRISRPVEDLTRTARRITTGDLSLRVQRYPTNELGELGRAFDRMADHLQEEIRSLVRARDRLEAVLKGMVEGVMLLDQDGRVLLTNRALWRLLHLTEDAVGRTITEVVRNADLQETVQKVLAGEVHLSTEIQTLGRNPRILEVNVVGITGEELGAVAAFHDITESKRLEQVRRDFVANVSHELRTPLTAIRGSVETLLGGALDNVQYAGHFVVMIQRHVERLQRLLDDLLDLAKIESGETTPRQDRFQSTEFADTVLGTVGELAASRGVELSWELPREPLSLTGDRRQLEQAVVNLLDNAIKYSEPGGKVTLRIDRTDGRVQLAVSDTGIGIASQHLPRIFERFYRVDKGRSRELGGTGLGLAIVKHIVQAHGGNVQVESTPGRGTTFRIALPQTTD
jgi:two-component system phosphate regulon sensor histidine kinase PhoR